MDFGTLLSVAQKNESKKQSTSYYPTKFTPPKKETKQSKSLSENIKRFLAKKEEEERRKALEEKRKKENLLALRDHKAQSRINKHLKVCKSANKSVLEDAVDNDNTAVTMAGPSQPDEDDYGYVSQEASAFYDKLMNKYNSLPPEKPLFSSSGKKSAKDIASTKDRVKQALKQQEIEDSLGHRKKRKSSSGKEGSDRKGENEGFEKDNDRDRDKDFEKEEKPKVKRKAAPPPLDFVQLLKLAEKKQYEPVEIKPKPKVEEPERLMTKKQMKEHAKEKEWREKRERGITGSSGDPANNESNNKVSKPSANKISKINGKANTPEVPEKALTKLPPIPIKKPTLKKPEKSNNTISTSSRTPTASSTSTKSSEKDEIMEERKKLEAEKRKLEEMRKAIEEEKRRLAQSKVKKDDGGSKIPGKGLVKSKSDRPMASSKDIKHFKDDRKPRPLSSGDIKQSKPSLSNGKPKQFPPSDVRPSIKSKSLSSANNKRRRIYDDDEEEYDSELDDFIDDGPEEGGEDYSKYISEIFGYDKNKYRHVDDDDTAMESSFAQQLKEEYVSTKIGILEDLEDIRMEAIEKKRKAMMRKKAKQK